MTQFLFISFIALLASLTAADEDRTPPRDVADAEVRKERELPLFLTVAYLSSDKPNQIVGAHAFPFAPEAIAAKYEAGRFPFQVIPELGVIQMTGPPKAFRNVDLSKPEELQDVYWLDLSYTEIQDADLTHVAKLKSLQSLELDHTSISNAGLNHLRSLKNLKTLNLRETAVSAEGVAEFLKWMPDVEVEK
jgi:hypothetical protein